MKTIKEMNKSAVPYRMGYKKCKEDILKLIDNVNNEEHLFPLTELKARIEG